MFSILKKFSNVFDKVVSGVAAFHLLLCLHFSRRRNS